MMRCPCRILPIGVIGIGLSLVVISPAAGEVTDLSGTAQMTVIQYQDSREIQRDTNRDAVPLITATPPATARARLERTGTTGITAAGQGLAVLQAADPLTTGTPNDAGLDMGAFSDDGVTSWSLNGQVTENRTIVLDTADLGGGVVTGGPTAVESRVLLSGVMLIVAMDPATDLSNTSVELTINVIQRASTAETFLLLDGTVTLSGGPNGEVTVSQATGAFANVSLPINDFPELTPNLPLVRAIGFQGLELKYQYEVIAGQAFDLALFVGCKLNTSPQGTGAAAVFGVPQQGMSAVLSKVKGDDRGQSLATAVAQYVDTTGQAYVSTPNPAPSLMGMLFPFCGGMGLESAGLAVVCSGVGALRFLGKGRRRRRRGGFRDSC